MKFFNKINNIIKKIFFLIRNINSKIKYDIKIYGSGKIELGRNISIERGCTIYVKKKSSLIIEDNVFIGKDSEINVTNKIFIGKNTTIQSRANIFGDVKILSNCIIGPNAYISSGKHIFSHRPYELIIKQDASTNYSHPIVINEDCFIGINAFIKPGITIGRGSIVGANSNILQNIEPYSVVGGNPAKVINKRINFLPPEEINSNNQSDIPYFYKGFESKNNNNNYEVFLRENNFTISLNVSAKKILSLEIISDFSSSLIMMYNNIQEKFKAGKNVLKFPIKPEVNHLIEFECPGYSKNKIFKIIKASVY